MMPKSEYDPNPQSSIAWQPGERTCRWLLFGIVAVLADCGLQIGGMVLDVHFWDDEGLTPAVAPGFVAILPQAVLLAAWLTLAGDVGSRSLWKSAAGFIATSTSGASPGVWMSKLEKRSWNALTPGSVPAGARISAGKSGNVAMSLPISAVVRVNWSPVSCIPSPESPANRMTT